MPGYRAHQAFTDYLRQKCLFDGEVCTFNDRHISDDSCMNSGDLYKHDENKLLRILCNALTVALYLSFTT